MNPSDLTLRPFFWRPTHLYPETEIISNSPTGTFKYSYGSFGKRVRRMIGALQNRGYDDGVRIGTLGWNHHRHFEVYFAVPLAGSQLHTINVVLSDEQIRHIIDDAGDQLLFVDGGEPLHIIERIWDRIDSVEEIIVMDDSNPDADYRGEIPVTSYESLIESSEPVTDLPPIHSDRPAGMCYTSGTTGHPKGVEYTHGMVYVHSLMVMTPAAIGIDETDVVLSMVPMFHVNSWEFPYAVTMAGAKHVFPGREPDPATIVSLIEDESVTLSAGVPTVWIKVLDYLDGNGGDLSSLERIIVGGSTAPPGIIQRYSEDFDVTIEHAWGMTETMSIGSVMRPTPEMDHLPDEKRFEFQTKQGLLSPGLEMKVVDAAGDEVTWDGDTYGELLVRGPTVVGEYHDDPAANSEKFIDGWLRTGDIVTVDARGFIEIVDRTKDIIKSGGEWISSIALENQLMADDRVHEAAVIAVPDEKWQERPIACVVAEDDHIAANLRDSLSESFPRWWLPDEIRFVAEIPKTATGKFDKKRLRDDIDAVKLPWKPTEKTK